jgi:hypothetical protein
MLLVKESVFGISDGAVCLGTSVLSKAFQLIIGRSPSAIRLNHAEGRVTAASTVSNSFNEYERLLPIYLISWWITAELRSCPKRSVAP